MDRRISAVRDALPELVLGLLGLLLVWAGVTYDVSILAWIGGPLVVASIYLHYHKLSKRAKKEGGTVIGPW